MGENKPVSPFTYYTFGEDKIFDERGNSFLAMRNVQWDRKDEGPDETKAKLELRKWIIGKDLKETPNKGFSFLTEDGPNNLAKTLVESGYGDTKELILELAKRDDFKETLEHINDTDDGADQFFDAREYLNSIA